MFRQQALFQPDQHGGETSSKPRQKPDIHREKEHKVQAQQYPVQNGRQALFRGRHRNLI